jgi:hypothetical protein
MQHAIAITKTGIACTNTRRRIGKSKAVRKRLIEEELLPAYKQNK